REIPSLESEDGRIQMWVPLEHIPPTVAAAVIAAEDRRFMRHHGVDLPALARAALTNTREASVVRGASTITQQLARGLFLTRERTWWRKTREIAIALLLELRYSKSQILEAYLNTVYLGQERGAAVQGVGAGARPLLGKSLETLRRDEVALLAAAIRAPNRVFVESPALLRKRRDRILEVMVKDGGASETAAPAAIAGATGARGARGSRASRAARARSAATCEFPRSRGDCDRAGVGTDPRPRGRPRVPPQGGPHG